MHSNVHFCILAHIHAYIKTPQLINFFLSNTYDIFLYKYFGVHHLQLEHIPLLIVHGKILFQNLILIKFVI